MVGDWSPLELNEPSVTIIVTYLHHKARCIIRWYWLEIGFSVKCVYYLGEGVGDLTLLLRLTLTRYQHSFQDQAPTDKVSRPGNI